MISILNLLVLVTILQFSPVLLDRKLPAYCPKLVSRDDWGARSPVEIDYALRPVHNVIIHHTVTETCLDENDCASLLTGIQNFHMDDLNFHDIGYNFMVGGDGKIYEGAGWHKVGAHTRGYNSRSIGLAFIGDYSTTKPNSKQIETVKNFLECAVEMGELDVNYKLFGARQVSSTQSPGLSLQREIKSWPHYTKSPPK